MVEDYTEEELNKLINECQKKYEKLEKETVMKALTGEIGTNSAMVEELEILNIHYHDEMDEYDLTALDLNPGLIENFKRAEREEMFNQKMWVNEDGHMCDEDGNRLSADGEHRVFEVIKCGK